MEEALKKRIEEIINKDKIVLFMKGNPNFPQCGFSARVIQVLSKYDVKFSFFNILQDEEVRQGLKEYANWPTFPQLWVNQKLVGGCDIICELDDNNQLKEVLEQ